MKVYWNNKSKRAEIIEDIEKDDAQPWESVEPKSHVHIGKRRVFINPPDYHIDGYSLNAQDLEELLARLNGKKPLICDGCNIRPPFEHRCHENRAFVNGEATGKSCECPDCSEPIPAPSAD